MTEKVAAKSRGRKPAAAKKETAKTTRASRSLSRNKAKADASAAKAPSPAKAAAKKTRGRSKTSRKDAKAEVDEPKPTRAAKRSRTRQEGGKQQPTRKAARASSKSKPKKASRSRSRSLSRTISRFKGMAKREVPKHIQPVDDILLEANHNLVRTPFDPCTYTGGLTVYDAPSRDDVLAAPDYVADIFQRLYNAEVRSSSPLLGDFLRRLPPHLSHAFSILFVSLSTVAIPTCPIHAQPAKPIFYHASHSD